MAVKRIEPTNDGKDMTGQYSQGAANAQIGVATACRRGGKPGVPALGVDSRQRLTAILVRVHFEKRQRAFVHAAAAIAVECLPECIFALKRCKRKQRHGGTELDVVGRAEDRIE